MDTSAVQRYLNASSEALKQEWNTLVRLALELSTDHEGGKAVQEAATALAFQSRAGTESIKRKILAIQHARATGLALEEIQSQGQEVTLSAFQANKRESQLEDQVWLKWKVTGVTRELVVREYERICDVLNFNTAEMFFGWLLAQLIHLTPEELKHSAGEATPPPPLRTKSPAKPDKSGKRDHQADAGEDTSDDSPR